MDLSGRGAILHTEEPHGLKNLLNMAGMCNHGYSIQNDTQTTLEDINIVPKNKWKSSNSPTGAEIWCTGEADTLERVSGALTTHRVVYSDKKNLKMTENCQNALNEAE